MAPAAKAIDSLAKTGIGSLKRESGTSPTTRSGEKRKKRENLFAALKSFPRGYILGKRAKGSKICSAF